MNQKEREISDFETVFRKSFGLSSSLKMMTLFLLIPVLKTGVENNSFLVWKRVRIFENRASRTLACENIRFSLLFAAGDVSPRNVPSGEGSWGTTQRNSNWSLRKTKIIVSFWKNKATRPRFLVLANFGACFSPEKPRDIAYISSIFKRMQRWWVSWIRSIYWFFFFFFFQTETIME